MSDSLNTPVVLIIFRRADFTRQVLDAIRRVKPRQLLVVADGPRSDRPDDVEACSATRSVIEEVDWECEVLKHYSDSNLGCGVRPATGITWAFQQVEQAIILEDDCVPGPSFFWFCQEILERYRDDQRVMHVGGSTYQRAELPVPDSYFFSCFNGAWGWATWRRAWQHFDMAVPHWPLLRDTTWLTDIVERQDAVALWAKEFEVAFQRKGKVDYWDHQWTFACWANSGLSVRPKQNLVSNIGCCPDATHTFTDADPRANIPAGEISFPLTHPPLVLQNRNLDRLFLKQIILRGAEDPANEPRIRKMLKRVTPSFARQAYRSVTSAFANGS